MLSVVRSGVLVVATLCNACATHVAAPYAPDYPSADLLRAASRAKVSVSPFHPLDADSPVNRLRLRGANFAAPGGTFVKYIEQALTRDLTEAGLLAAGAPTLIEGNVLVNDISVAGVVEGSGELSVELVVSRSGQQRLRKTYRATTRFDSAFMGAIAVQQGQASYPTLVRTLLRKVYADPEFLDAIRP